MDVPTGPVVVAPQKRGSTILNVLLGVAVLVAVGGIAFAVGRITAPATTNAATTGFGGNGAFGGSGAIGGSGVRNRGGAGGFGGIAGAGAVTLSGTVTDVTAGVVTVHLDSGQDVKVSTDTSTTYHQQATGAAADVQSGKKVLVEIQGFGRGAGAGAVGGSGVPAPVGGSGGFGGFGGSGAIGGSGVTPQLGPARDITIVGQ